jgi:hypothetical protein
MKFVRSVIHCICLHNIKEIEDIRTELQIFLILDEVADYRKRWVERLDTKEDRKIPKQTEQRRDFMRPRKS